MIHMYTHAPISARSKKGLIKHYCISQYRYKHMKRLRRLSGMQWRKHNTKTNTYMYVYMQLYVCIYACLYPWTKSHVSIHLGLVWQLTQVKFLLRQLCIQQCSKSLIKSPPFLQRLHQWWWLYFHITAQQGANDCYKHLSILYFRH